MKRAAILLIVTTLLPAGVARAHPGSTLTGYVSTVSAVVPNVLGVNALVLGGDDRLRISNYSGKAIVILGYEGEPYLRFGDGAVFVNTRSPAAYLNRFRNPPALPPGAADASARPVWRRVQGGVTFEWHDHRIHWAAREAPRAVADDPRHTHLIRNWRVPGRAAGQPFAIAGFLGYVPPRGTRAEEERNWPLLGGAACGLALAALGAGVGARRARRRAP
jgi:hypothetical protein